MECLVLILWEEAWRDGISRRRDCGWLPLHAENPHAHSAYCNTFPDHPPQQPQGRTDSNLLFQKSPTTRHLPVPSTKTVLVTMESFHSVITSMKWNENPACDLGNILNQASWRIKHPIIWLCREMYTWRLCMCL